MQSGFIAIDSLLGSFIAVGALTVLIFSVSQNQKIRTQNDQRESEVLFEAALRETVSRRLESAFRNAAGTESCNQLSTVIPSLFEATDLGHGFRLAVLEPNTVPGVPENCFSSTFDPDPTTIHLCLRILPPQDHALTNAFADVSYSQMDVASGTGISCTGLLESSRLLQNSLQYSIGWIIGEKVFHRQNTFYQAQHPPVNTQPPGRGGFAVADDFFHVIYIASDTHNK